MQILIFFRNTVSACCLLAILFLCLHPGQSLAQNVVTQDKWVRGEVEQGTGLVSWYEIDGPLGKRSLSYNRHSYLTVAITSSGGTKYYTNNDLGPTPTPQGYLNNGVVSLIPGAGHDTVRTVWNISGVDIIQDVYPFDFENSGQIVLKIRAKNRGSAQATVQAQYLLDIDVNGNDAAKTLTRYAYDINWNSYPNASLQGVPPFYVAFEKNLPAVSKTIGTGYFDNSAEQLLVPYSIIIGDWTRFVNNTWGYTPPLGTPYGDNAILIQWNAMTAVTDSTAAPVEIGRTSYGTGEFNTCFGDITTLLFYPQRIKYNKATRAYINSPFTVEAIIFNTHSAESASNSSAKLTVGPELRIIAPKPLAVDSLTQSHAPNPVSIPALSVSDALWTVMAPLAVGCSGDVPSTVGINVTASGNFFGPPGGCPFPIVIECSTADTLGPRFTGNSGPTGSLLDSTFSVFDSSQNDLGMKSVAYTITSSNPAKFSVTINGGSANPTLLTGCPKTVVPIAMHRTDTSVGGCIDFTFTDCANLTSTKEVCFRAYPPPMIRDTTKPILTLVGHIHYPTLTRPDTAISYLDSSRVCAVQLDSMIATDERQNDFGLASIFTPVPPVNMRLNLPIFSKGVSRIRFSVSVIDSMKDGSITLRAQDTSGNFSADTTLTYCHTPDVLRPILTVGQYTKGTWHVVVDDSRNWDLGIDSILLSFLANVKAVPDPTIVSTTLPRLHHFEFDMVSQDTFNHSGFCVIAKDVAGNRDKDFGGCVSFDPLEDIWNPHLNFIPTPDPRRILVTVDDIHISKTGETINYDTGIDSVWFTKANNILLTFNGKTSTISSDTAIHNVFDTKANHPPFFPKTIPSFFLSVADTNSPDPTACVTVHVYDGHQHENASAANDTVATWCYPVSQDYQAPIITGTSATNSQVAFDIADNRFNDRGLGTLKLIGPINFAPLSNTYNGEMQASLSLNVVTPGKSATGTLQLVDRYGVGASTTLQASHTTTVFAAIYAQNMKMKAAHLILQPQDFTVPVLLDSTDDFPLLQKQLSEYSFTFGLTGSPLISYLNPITVGSQSANWTVTSTPGPNRTWTIDAKAPAGTVLGSMTDTVLFLRFHGESSDTAGRTTIALTGGVTYNGGGQLTVLGTPTTSSLILPKPYGSITAGNIVIKGTCSPLVSGSGLPPNAISLAPTSPNPVVQSTHVLYTIPADGLVQLDLFDALGAKVQTLISENQKAGEYTFDFKADGLATGAYFLRLQANGAVRTRRVAISK